jgi:N-acyl-D-amino-acid deacylase
MKADLVIFDPARITEKATIREPHLYPEGIKWTIVNGRITLQNGEHTGRKAGELLLRT